MRSRSMKKEKGNGEQNSQSYKAPIKDENSERFLPAGPINVQYIPDITELQLERCVEKGAFANLVGNSYNLWIVQYMGL